MNLMPNPNKTESAFEQVDTRIKNDYDPSPFNKWGKILGVFLTISLLLYLFGAMTLGIYASPTIDGKINIGGVAGGAVMLGLAILISVSLLIRASVVFSREAGKLSGAPRLKSQASTFMLCGVLSVVAIGILLGIFADAHFVMKKKRPLELCKKFGVEKFFFETEYKIQGKCNYLMWGKVRSGPNAAQSMELFSQYSKTTRED